MSNSGTGLGWFESPILREQMPTCIGGHFSLLCRQYPRKMIHHISIGVSDILASGAFYDAILKPLGYIRAFEDLRPGEKHQAIGYGSEIDEDKFTIKERFSTELSPGPGFHLAFSAPNREAVDEWHRQGIALGAKNQGEPQIWLDFGPNYYAAYLLDPDGWQIEAVFKMA